MYSFNSKITIKTTGQIVGSGWLPPKPDLRDYTPNHKELIPILKKLTLLNNDPGPGTRHRATRSAAKIPPQRDINPQHATRNNTIPSAINLRQWFSPVDNQGPLGSCTAHAGTGIAEYFQSRAFGKYTEGSRLFLYKTTRNLMQTTGDTGGWIRSTMGAIVLCGIPPEKYYPYNIADFDNEPDPFVYSLADNFRGVKYFCHDPIRNGPGHAARGARCVVPPWGLRGEGRQVQETDMSVLDSVKKYLAAGIPSMFGFWGFPSFEDSDIPGAIPFPGPDESAAWGHAVAAAGYDDSLQITNTGSGEKTTGALLIRNSWGEEWGDRGYGWLPYQYVVDRLALDFWSLISMEWVETGAFG